MPTRQGSFRLFKLFGIEVFLHWSWFVIAIIGLQLRKDYYSSLTWNVLEYLTLFAIVLTHEFGHALACRSVGGQANQIVLWPFGGVAYVSPPQRPGAVLWSIVAGPLVNVALVPILTAVLWFAGSAGWRETIPNLYGYIETIWYINVFLLAFNIMPVYPLDGGKIVYALLWFVLGRARALMAATVIGFIGIAGLAGVVIWLFTASPQEAIWPAALWVFLLLNCFQGFRQAREMLRITNAPRRGGYRCPQCKTPPPLGDFWTCGKCRQRFDLFAMPFACPHCGTQYGGAVCLDCGMASRLSDWAPLAPPPVIS